MWNPGDVFEFIFDPGFTPKIKISLGKDYIITSTFLMNNMRYFCFYDDNTNWNELTEQEMNIWCRNLTWAKNNGCVNYSNVIATNINTISPRPGYSQTPVPNLLSNPFVKELNSWLDQVDRGDSSKKLKCTCGAKACGYKDDDLTAHNPKYCDLITKEYSE